MNDKTITALAREYAEEEAKGTAVDALPNGLKESVIQRNADHFEKHLRFLLRRYCLVEKSKIIEEYKAAQKDQHSNDSIRFIVGRNVSAALANIFPEIAKEEEG